MGVGTGLPSPLARDGVWGGKIVGNFSKPTVNRFGISVKKRQASCLADLLSTTADSPTLCLPQERRLPKLRSTCACTPNPVHGDAREVG